MDSEASGADMADISLWADLLDEVAETENVLDDPDMNKKTMECIKT